MPLSLTCDCGARFEVEEALAGQTVSCPECQQTLKAPAAQRVIVRTNNFALASFLLAIVGAFTVVGTVAAVILGGVAVTGILRDRERQAGLGFAFTGVILGLIFTTLTLWALSTGEIFGGMRRLQMADQLEAPDPKAPLTITENGFSITRPSIRWVRAKKGFQFMLVQPLLRSDALLLLVQPDLYAFVDAEVEADGRNITSIDDFILARIRPEPDQGANNPPTKGKPNARPKNQPQDDEREEPARVGQPQRTASRELPADDGIEQAHETTVEVPLDGKGWTMLVRTYRTTGGKLYIVRGFAETAHFARAKDELTKALDSFKITPGP